LFSSAKQLKEISGRSKANFFKVCPYNLIITANAKLAFAHNALLSGEKLLAKIARCEASQLLKILLE
jgi:hypothetical protein